jgi:hypothetical protein
MLDDPRFLVALGCAVAGLGWWFGVEFWRGVSREHSARVFWLHLTAPPVAIVLMTTAIGLVATSDRFRKARSRAPDPALQPIGPARAGRAGRGLLSRLGG